MWSGEKRERGRPTRVDEDTEMNSRYLLSSKGSNIESGVWRGLEECQRITCEGKLIGLYRRS